MTWHVTCRIGNDDTFEPNIPSDDEHFFLPVEASDHSNNLQSNVWEIIDRRRLDPTQEAADFYRIAATVQAADIRIPRKESFDNWTRDITLHLPVSDENLWVPAKEPLTKLLRFLTGDQWSIHLREADTQRPTLRKRLRGKANPMDTQVACLFSGGLDSFIGAVSALENGKDPYLVSHRGRGGTASHVSPAQKTVYGTLEDEYGENRMRPFRALVYPPKPLTDATELTTRSRSIVFFALGALVASSLDQGATLLYPENGFISLNVPLTHSRLGSMSTRTTHPHTISLLEEVFPEVNLDVNLENPFRFKTKGEMCQEVENVTAFQSGVHDTLSCAHPSQSRFQGRRHCGYCLPCIIRRAALAKVGLDNASAYNYDFRSDDLTEGKREDLRALEIAIQSSGDSPYAELMKSGPMPSDVSVLQKHARVYKRGLEEVANFLS